MFITYAVDPESTMRKLVVYILLMTSCLLSAQESGNRLRFNVGIKTGFQAITYNDPSFEIENYEYNESTIQSNKIGYTIAPFFRLSYGKLYIQTDAAIGVSRHSFDFTDTRKGSITNVTPNIPQYELRTFCLQVPLLIGYEYIKEGRYGMSVFTGPRTKFIFDSVTKQEFEHFSYYDLHEVLEKRVYFWEIGLGVKIYNVFFDFVYDIGLTNTTKYIEAPKVNKKFPTKRRDNILSFSVGVIF